MTPSDHPTAAVVDPTILGGVSPSAWDDVAGPHFYATARWLNLCASHAGGHQGAAISGPRHAPTAVVPFTDLTEAPTTLYRWNDRLAEFELPRLRPDGLLVGPRQGYRTQFLVAPGADRIAETTRLVDALRERARRPRQDDQACVAMYLTTEDVRALAAAGVNSPPVLLEADAWIRVPEVGWEGWLDTLPSKRRVSVRREVRRFEEAGYQVEHLPLAACLDKLPTLAAATQSRYGAEAPTSFWLSLLRKHLDCMGDAARVSICFREGDDPVGFCLYYLWSGVAHLRWAGFDYRRLVGAAEYFNLAYYDHIRRAPAVGTRWIHAGIKAAAAKALRGAELRPLWLVDLAPDSPMTKAGSAVRAHNSRVFATLIEDPNTRLGMRDRAGWLDLPHMCSGADG